MYHILFRAIAAGVLASAVMVSTPLVAGQAQSPLAPTADIVFAIDQSGSMQLTDPAGMRISVVQSVLGAPLNFANRPVVRVGVITFGSPGVSPPTGPDIVRALAPIGLAEVLPATPDEQQSLAGTDFISTLCLSWAVVTHRAAPATAGCPALPPIPSHSSETATDLLTRTIVLITDGVPAPDGSDLSFNAGDSPEQCKSTLSAAHDYLCELRRVWHALEQAEPVNLYVIGLDASGRLFPPLEPYWRAITGCQTDAECRLAVRRTFDPIAFPTELLETATGNIAIACGTQDSVAQCLLPAWLSHVQFSIRGIDSPELLRVVDAERRDRRAGGKAIFSGSEQQWFIQRPSKGVWRIESASPAATLTVDALLTTQRFHVTANGRPTAGQDVTLALMPDGPLLVDQATLVGEDVEVRSRRAGDAETVITRGIAEVLDGQVIIASALSAAEAGEWTVTVTARSGDQSFFLGRGTFPVGAGTQSASTASIAPSVTQASVSMPAPAEHRSGVDQRSLVVLSLVGVLGSFLMLLRWRRPLRGRGESLPRRNRR